MFLTFAEPYAGVFFTDEKGVIAEDALGGLSVGWWAYGHPYGTVAFVVGGRHLEPVGRSLQLMHQIARGSSMLAAVVSGVRGRPALHDSYLFRIPVATYESSAIDVLMAEDPFLLYLPHSAELLALLPPQKGLQILERLGLGPQTTTGLVLQARSATTTPARSPRTAAQPYDPLAAQIREIAGPLSDAANQLAVEAVDLWRTTLNEEPPQDVATWPASVATVVEERRKLLSTDVPDGNAVHLFRALDSHSAWLQAVCIRAAELANCLRDFERDDYREGKPRTYETLAGPVVLRCARNFLADASSRLGISSAVDFLPAVAHRFALSHVTVEGSLREGTMLVTMPSACRLRLGAFPILVILVHELAHVVVERQPELVETLLDLRWSDPLVSSAFKSLDLNPAPMGFDEEADYVRTERICRAWAVEILADLCAAAVTGPAFLYAMARFALGTLGELVSSPRTTDTHPPFVHRLRFTYAFLRATQGEVSFASRYFEPPDAVMPERLIKAVRSAVAHPFDPDMPLETVEAQLRAGQVSSAWPIEVIAALWSGVVARRGYLHEVAALLSIERAPLTTVVRGSVAGSRG